MKSYKTLLLIFLSLYTIAQINCGENLFEDKKEEAEKIFKKMSEEEKLGALFLLKYPEDISKYEKGNYPSGFLLNSDFFNKTDEDLEHIFKNLQKKAKYVKFTIGVEEEGGDYVTVSGIHRDEPFMSPMDTLLDGGKSAFTTEEHEKIEFLKEMYTNMNLAPVADVCSRKDAPIWKRTVGLDADKTTEAISKMVDEYIEDGYCACIKHFPGLGDNDIISDVSQSPTDNRTEDEITEQLKPFTDAIEAKIPMVFLANLKLPTKSDDPVSISKEWHDYLYNDLGFGGLTLAEVEPTEDNLKKIFQNYEYEMLLVNDFDNALKNAQTVYKDQAIKEKIDETVLRILEWKLTLIKTFGPKKKNNFTGIVLSLGIASFAIICVIAFLIYKFWLSKKEEEGLGEIAQFGGHPAYREESMVSSQSSITEGRVN